MMFLHDVPDDPDEIPTTGSFFVAAVVSAVFVVAAAVAAVVAAGAAVVVTFAVPPQPVKRVELAKTINITSATIFVAFFVIFFLLNGYFLYSSVCFFRFLSPRFSPFLV